MPMLSSHPDTSAKSVRGIEAWIISLDANWLRLRWRIDGSRGVQFPPFAGKGRADGLWQHTCFELFVMREGFDGYLEFNFSPSQRWAAYAFAGYRAEMTEYPLPHDPACTLRIGAEFAIFDVAVPAQGLPPAPWRYGLSAVIEETGGTKSYWALAHSSGAPDFHHPACFAATLPAPEAI